MKVSDYISSSLTGNSSTPVRTHSFTHSNTDINLQTQRPPIISWQPLTGQCSHLCWGGTEWQFGPTDAEKKVHSLRILVLTRLSRCSSTNSSVPELWSRFLQVSWSCWWSHESKTHLCTDFLWNSSQLWQSHRGHMTEPTWEPRFQLWSADLSARASYQ